MKMFRNTAIVLLMLNSAIIRNLSIIEVLMKKQKGGKKNTALQIYSLY